MPALGIQWMRMRSGVKLTRIQHQPALQTPSLSLSLTSLLCTCYLQGRLGYNNYEMPDDAPVYPCQAAVNCNQASAAYSLPAAYDGADFTNATYGMMSRQLTTASLFSSRRFTYVYYQVQLDSAYDDIVAVDIWTTNTDNLTRFSSALSIYLSTTPQYLCPTCGYACVTGFNATLSAPLRNTANCSQTLASARYVTVHRAITSVTNDRLYLYEMKVVRAGK